jgi:HK97 family phage major capsid protein
MNEFDLKIKGLNEEIGTLSTQAKGIYDTAKAENRNLTADEQKSFDSVMDQIEENEKEVKRQENLKKLAERDNTPVQTPGVKKVEMVDELAGEGQKAFNTIRLLQGIVTRNSNLVEKSIENLARGGHYGKKVAELVQRGAGDYYSTLVDADGAHLLPTTVRNEIEGIADVVGVIRRIAKVYTNVVGTIKAPGVTGTLVASAVAEGGEISSSKRAFKALPLNPKKWAGIAPWTFEADLEIGVQILNDITTEIGEAFARAEDDAAFNADGSATYNSVTGIFNLAGTGTRTLTAGSTGFTDITPDDLVLARNEIPASLRKRGVYVFHPDMEAHFLTKKDGNGAYIFDYVEKDGVSTIKGRPVYYSEMLPDLSASAAATAFGIFADFKFWNMALGAGVTTQLMDTGIVKDADTGADINLGTQDLKALKFREQFDAGTNFANAFCTFETAAS